jgi:predicted hydrolase (HD superfamily)
VRTGEEFRDQPGCRKTEKNTKDKTFARSVNRQESVDGAQELGVPLEEHIDFCVRAMQANAEALGIKGGV